MQDGERAIDTDLPAARRSVISGQLASALLANNWTTAAGLAVMTAEDERNTLIDRLAGGTAAEIPFLQSLTNDELVWKALMHAWLKESRTRTVEELTAMSPEDHRNTMIVRLAELTGTPGSVYQGYSDASLVRAGYAWWLEFTYQAEIAALEMTGADFSVFELEDNLGSSMDVLKVLPFDGEYGYLGFYHTPIGPNIFQLRLAGSDDLVNWTVITSLGDHNHQADAARLGEGYLVVNETDGTEDGNSLRIRYFSSVQDLYNGSPAVNDVLPHSFATPAEGTPSIRRIEGDGPNENTLLLGFHYFNTTNQVDDLAFGTLRNLDMATWKVWRDDVANNSIRALGFTGNIGSRSGFYNDCLSLQESQRHRGDWSSWRVLLGNNICYMELEPRTPQNSVSFANPKISRQDGGNDYLVTYFLPTQGNSADENGTLLYRASF
jgi:hypothetical protein